ncbi:MAG: IS256 family transposase [Olsenella sp.]|jgi:transposase-like protein|nr:IS256 family transposase [Olsenella sp.]MCI1644591.1 IS256 family transposase [Olsenella sp.]
MVNNNRMPHDSPELREVLMGFLDSASSLCDMMNTTMAAVLNEVMSIQADEACGAGYGERSDARVNSRNGYRERRLETTVGTLPLLVPKLRSGSYFPTDLFERWSRTDRALAAAVAETCVTGTSTRKVEKVAAKFGVESLTKDQVSRLCAVIDGEVDAFLEKDWSGMSFAYLFLDATYVGCRVGGRVLCEAFITAIGVGDDGHRHFLGFTCANAESYASWRGFLQDLEERGVRGARLVTSDAHDGLRRAISEVYPEATWQRCIVHVKRDALAKIDGAGAQRRARAAMAPIFKESDPALVRALYHEAVGGLESFAPAAAKVLEGAEVDALAHLSFPREHRVKIRANNVQERANCELKRRAKVVQAFPSTGSVMRLLGGIVDEINADWESGRLFMSKESLKPVLGLERAENRVGEFAPDEEARSRAKVIMRIALDECGKAA